MFRTIGDGPSGWELLLPAEVLRLPVELARVRSQARAVHLKSLVVAVVLTGIVILL